MTAAPAPPFQAFYVAHRAAVLRLLVGMVGPVDAEDCFQETFLKALRAWPPSERGAGLDAWVLVIARRTALDLLRRRGREADLDASGLDIPDPSALASAPPEALWAAVRRLPPKQRAAVVLHVVLDLSHAQVAAALDGTEAAARRSYADGITALRRNVSKQAVEVE